MRGAAALWMVGVALTAPAYAGNACGPNATGSLSSLSWIQAPKWDDDKTDPSVRRYAKSLEGNPSGSEIWVSPALPDSRARLFLVRFLQGGGNGGTQPYWYWTRLFAACRSGQQLTSCGTIDGAGLPERVEIKVSSRTTVVVASPRYRGDHTTDSYRFTRGSGFKLCDRRGNSG